MDLLKLTVKENGVLWTGLLGVYYTGSAVAEAAFQRCMKLRQEKGLPGINSADINRQIWDNWDWEAAGEEWTPTPEWKASLLEHILRPNVPENSVIVEIGPGGGRWTEHLIPRASRFTGIDISAKCIEICSAKFADAQNAQFRVGSGTDLPGVEEESTDIIWSFDVFVHINQPEVQNYVREFRRVLKPGGRVIIHHGSAAGVHGGWRSNLTTEAFNRMLEGQGFKVLEQMTEWKDAQTGKTHEVGLYQDVVTVFEKPQG
jgi:ubiquinone/menaquinone biosynthesis C-methylase UbiE